MVHGDGGAMVDVSYAIVFVSDMKRSVAFYRDGLAISVREAPRR
ncbi:MAG TPA: hypothetical protein VJ803_07955 [Gemmatimonadaceae bacterium]|nr:hypothetical protein [Gemmatimonadaceae bacterium]